MGVYCIRLVFCTIMGVSKGNAYYIIRAKSWLFYCMIFYKVLIAMVFSLLE